MFYTTFSKFCFRPDLTTDEPIRMFASVATYIAYDKNLLLSTMSYFVESSYFHISTTVEIQCESDPLTFSSCSIDVKQY